MFFSGLAAVSGIGNAYYAFAVSDGVGQGIVVLLAVMLVAVSSFILDKYLAMKKVGKLSEKFWARFKQCSSVADVTLYKESSHDSGPLAQIYAAGAEKLFSFYGDAAGQGKTRNLSNTPCRLTLAQREAIRTVLENEVSEQVMALENGVPLLSLAVSVSPFFGLFGTVWGVMQAFCGAAQMGRADIGALAPGLAGALLTTVAGLTVAIAALVPYNMLTNTIRKNTVFMDNFVEDFITRLGLEQLAFEEAEPRSAGNAAVNSAEPDSAYESAQVVMPLNSLLKTRSAAMPPQGGAAVPRNIPAATPLSAAPATPATPVMPSQITVDSPLQPRVIIADNPPAGRQDEMSFTAADPNADNRNF